jgi:hypothetical protein
MAGLIVMLLFQTPESINHVENGLQWDMIEI